MKNMQQTAYEQLRQMIIDGALTPEEPLIEKDLMKRLNVGRTPLREAMQQLQMEGMLVIRPRSGTFVRPLDVEDVIALYQARLVLEPEIVSIGTALADRTILMMYRNMFIGDNDRSIMARCDVSFHRFLYQSTRNRYLERTMDIIFFQDQRIRAHSFVALKDLVITNQTHVEIIDRMLEGDAEAAKEAMYRHIIQSRETALSLLLNPGISV